MKKLLGYFFQGLLYTVPITVTIYVFYLVFRVVDGILLPYITKLLPVEIPGLGFVVIILLITVVGILGKIVIRMPVVAFFNRMMEKAPVIKLIYSSIKDLLSAFVGKERKFNNPVLVKVNNVSNLHKIGFLTQEDVSFLNMKDKMVAVYFPHSYAWSGEHYIVPVQDITPVNAPPAEVMKFIVSGGVAKFNLKNEKL